MNCKKFKFCLTFGKCNSKFCTLVSATIGINIISILLIILFLFYSFKYDITYLNSVNVMSYLFFTNLCESLMIFPNFILKNSIGSNHEESIAKKKETLNIKYIFNKNTVKFSIIEKIILTFVGTIKLFVDVFYISYQFYIEKKYDFVKVLTYSFHFELIFLFLISKLMYNITYYKHQYLAIIIVTILGFFLFIIEYEGEGLGYFFINLICHIIFSFLKSLVTVYIKGMMEYKYISAYRASFMFSIINIIIIFVVYLIVSFFPCDSEYCKTQYNGKYYFGNLLSLFNMSFLFLLIIFILKSILLVLNFIIIYDFSVCHSFLIIQLTQMIGNVSLLLLNLEETYYILIMILFFFGINIFFILLFLEIIEVNICNISYNTKKNIQIRAKSEMEISNLALISDDNTVNNDDITDLGGNEDDDNTNH